MAEALRWQLHCVNCHIVHQLPPCTLSPITFHLVHLLPQLATTKQFICTGP